MRKFLNNLIQKISLEFLILFVSIFLVTGGFVYATWNQAQTDLSDQYDKIDSVKWNALVDQIYSDCMVAGNSSCILSTANKAKTVSEEGVFYLTQENWYGLVDLINQALSVCNCQISPCGQWTQAKSPTGISRTTWNILVNEVYKKCSGSSCWNNANTAKIVNVKLTKTNWNGLVALLSTTMSNCQASPSENEEEAEPGPENEEVPPPCSINCAGKVCGDDGCGGSCGSCNGLVCNNGQCENTIKGNLFSGPGACADHCASINGICNSVGTDNNGTNGLVSSIITDKFGAASCSDIAGSCSTGLIARALLCSGQQSDWTHCNCTTCASNWKHSCGQNLGDATCIKTGSIDCYGQCQGASLLPDGTNCSTSTSTPAQCKSGKCTTCSNSYDNLCGYSLGFLECINLGKYNCFGSCVGASRKDPGTVCGTSMTCNSSGVCELCTPECTGKQCGANGCGGSCGDCEAGKEVCNPVTGQCILSTGYLMTTGQSCNALCSSMNGLCSSVGTDSDGKNGLIRSVTVDAKGGTETCSTIAGNCSTVLGSHPSICDGRQTDWAYCNCKICDINWNGPCGQDLGDASCISLGTTNCDGQCVGFSYKAAGKLCGGSLECDGLGQCKNPLGMLVKVNSATGRSCSDICQNDWNGRHCVGVGTNSDADNSLIKSADIDAKSGATTCKEIAGGCDTVVNNLSNGCDGIGAEWTNCRCSL